MSDTCPKNCPESVDLKLTLWPVRRCPCASSTVAVTVAVEVPLARITAGLTATWTVAADPTVWVRVAVPDTVPSVAVIVGVPTVVELVIVAV